jgi:hypothetical protein
MNTAKKILAALAAVSLATAAQAGTPAAQGSVEQPEFAQHKQRELARIAERIRILQTLQSCVQSASNHAAVKSCNEAAHGSMRPGQS